MGLLFSLLPFGYTLFFNQIVLAQASSGKPGPTLWEQLLPFVFMILIFYIFLIRPNAKKMKDHQKFLTDLKVGDPVLTASGIYGTIVGLTDEFVTLEVDKDVRLRILKSQISTAHKTNKEGSKK